MVMEADCVIMNQSSNRTMFIIVANIGIIYICSMLQGVIIKVFLSKVENHSVPFDYIIGTLRVPRTKQTLFLLLCNINDSIRFS